MLFQRSTLKKPGVNPSLATLKNRILRPIAYSGPLGLTASLMITCAPVALRAEPTVTIQELAAEIAALKAENREMKKAITSMHGETRRTEEKVEKVRQVAQQPAYSPPYGNPIPAGAIPAFVTADKTLIFGGITLTPGGFIAGEDVFRSKTTNSDINSAWNNIPYNNSALAHLNENRFTGRQSRVSLLAEGAVNPSTIASGYGEFDFLGAGTTSNATDTNSYAPRIRQLYAAVDWNDIGMHVMAGQMWSLTTLNSKGITPRNEVPPPLIDGQFMPGFIFARQAGLRITKDFNKDLWFSLGLEEAQTTFPAGATAACQGTALTAAPGAAPVTVPVGGATGLSAVCGATASGAGFSQYGQPYSLNHLPDIIGKVAYEAHIADRDIHIEGMALYKDLYNASYLTATNTGFSTHDVGGYGFGGGLVVPVIPKLLDFQGSAMAGRGIGRYGAGLLPDSTLNADGSLRPVGEVMGMAGLTLHATPALDIYAFAGIERQNAAYTNVGGTYIGYGVPNADNSGCNNLNGACSGQTHSLWQLTGGAWYKVYSGSFGEVRTGIQYSYTERDAFTTQTTPTAPVYSAKTDEHTFLTSLRYYPFAGPSIAPPLVAKY
jgi:hypothetical protein